MGITNHTWRVFNWPKNGAFLHQNPMILDLRCHVINACTGFDKTTCGSHQWMILCMKLTQMWKAHGFHWKMIYIWWVFHIYVSLQEGTDMGSSQNFGYTKALSFDNFSAKYRGFKHELGWGSRFWNSPHTSRDWTAQQWLLGVLRFHLMKKVMSTKKCGIGIPILIYHLPKWRDML